MDKLTLHDIALSTLYDTVKKIVDKTAVRVKLEGVGFVYHVPRSLRRVIATIDSVTSVSSYERLHI